MEKSSTPATITLSNPSIHSDMLKTTVNYIITTSASEKTITATRTYEEFLHLRKTLTQKWPGIYLPPLPPKTFLSFLSSKSIKTYKNQLSDFLSYTSLIPFIYNSEEFQYFLKSKSPFSQKLNVNLTDLSLTYQAIFHEYSGRALNQDILPSLKQELTYFQLSLQRIIDLRDKAEILVEDFKKFHTLLAGVSNSLEKNEKLFITCPDSKDIFVHPDLTLIKNNFSELNLWAEAEILQLESLNDAIIYVEKLEKVIENCEIGIESCKREMDKVGNNKISIVKIFSFKGKDRFVEDKNLEIARKQNEMMNLKKFQTIVALRLVENDIPRFKSERLECYEKMRMKYNEIVQKSLEVLRNAANKTLIHVSRNNYNN